VTFRMAAPREGLSGNSAPRMAPRRRIFFEVAPLDPRSAMITGSVTGTQSHQRRLAGMEEIMLDDLWLLDEPIDDTTDPLTLPVVKQHIVHDRHDDELGLRRLVERLPARGGPLDLTASLRMSM